MAEANTPADKSELTSKVEAKTAREYFQGLYVEWLRTRARYLSGESDTESEDVRLMYREEELARLITTTPSVEPWMIQQKIEVLEYYLCAEGGTSWTDNREVVMVGAIRADLLRFPPHDDSEDE